MCHPLWCSVRRMRPATETASDPRPSIRGVDNIPAATMLSTGWGTFGRGALLQEQLKARERTSKNSLSQIDGARTVEKNVMSRPGYSAQLSSIEQALLRPHRNTRRASGHTAAVLKRTKIRLAAGSNGTLPLPCTKIRKGRRRIGIDRRRHTAGRRR